MMCLAHSVHCEQLLPYVLIISVYEENGKNHHHHFRLLLLFFQILFIKNSASKSVLQRAQVKSSNLVKKCTSNLIRELRSTNLGIKEWETATLLGGISMMRE